MRTTVNPATAEVLAEYALHGEAEIETRLATLARESQAWRTTTIGRRAKLLSDVAAYFRREATALATLMTDEMGKPIVEARAEVEKCAAGFEYYAEHGPAMLDAVPVATDAGESYYAYRPLGAVLAIMPWNFPYWQVVRFAAPAVLAGNVGVLKHAANVTGCGLALERAFLEAGAPPGVFTNLLIENDRIAALIEDRRIHAITLTGSGRAGAAVASQAGKALKKTVLELGGSDAFIVCADADLDGAAEFAVKSRYQNAGQSCIAAKRFLIDKRIYDEFLERFTAKVEALRMGPPRDESTTIGPLARHDLRDTIIDQVQRAVSDGAHVHTGGKAVFGPGAYYEPTILTQVTPEISVMEEEVFGPVAAVMKIEDIEDAVDKANDSVFGLGGNIWTRDLDRAKRIAARLETGNVFVNGMTKSDPRLPFGGVKQSGYGRELSSIGMHEFMNMQTVWIGK